MTPHRLQLVPLFAVLTAGLLASAQETSTHRQAGPGPDAQVREDLRRAEEARREARKQVEEAKKQAYRQLEEARKQARSQVEEARKKAQLQMEEARRQIEAAMKQYRAVARMHWLGSFFPRLGLVMKIDPGSPSSQGIAIQGVTPGSPAEKAGLKAGDVVTALDGHPLAEVRDGFKAVAGAHRLRPGDSVIVDYRRGTESKRAELTAEPKGARAWSVSSDDLRSRFAWLELPDHWRELELVTVNPELGQYFGTKQGLLVVHASSAEDAKLKPGDVILRIGEVQLSTPTQAVRALRSYEPGQEVPVEILRQKEKRTLAIRLPASQDRQR